MALRRHKDSDRTRREELRAKLGDSSEFKRQTFYALENIRKAKLPGKIVGIALFVLIVLNAAIVFVSAQPGLDPVAGDIIQVFYTFSTACFAVEYAARIWIADLAYGHVSPAKARLKYIISPLGIIDLLSFFPNMLAWFLPITPALRNAINLVRLVRLIKISRYMRGLRTIGRVVMNRRSEIVAAFLVIGLLIVVASVVMYEIEHPAQPEAFNSLFSGLWWAVETVTGTGYGDIVPITVPGRIVGAIIMFLSVALVAIPGGIFSAGFVSEYQNANLRKIERDVKRNSERDDARDSAKDSSRDSARDSAKDSARDSARDVAKDTASDAADSDGPDDEGETEY